MKGTTELIATINEIDVMKSDLEDKISKREADEAIKNAIDESKRYTDLLDRSLRREHRREQRINQITYRNTIVSLFLFFISVAILISCECTSDLGMETTDFKALVIISIIMLIGSCIIFIPTLINYESFYKIKYSVCYKKIEDRGSGKKLYAHVFRTKSISSEKALKRFHKLYDNDETIRHKYTKVIDEFGTVYNKEGKVLYDN